MIGQRKTRDGSITHILNMSGQPTLLPRLWKNISFVCDISIRYAFVAYRSHVIRSSSSFHLLDLPPELLMTILTFCTKTDVKRLCETCQTLRDFYVCTRVKLDPLALTNTSQMPELYHTVVLSSRTASMLCKTYNKRHPGSYNDDPDVPLDFT